MSNNSYLFVKTSKTLIKNIDVVKYSVLDLHLNMFKNYKNSENNDIIQPSKVAIKIIESILNSESDLTKIEKEKILNHYLKFSEEYPEFRYNAEEIIIDNYDKFLQEVRTGNFKDNKYLKSYVDYFFS